MSSSQNPSTPANKSPESKIDHSGRGTLTNPGPSTVENLTEQIAGLTLNDKDQVSVLSLKDANDQMPTFNPDNVRLFFFLVEDVFGSTKLNERNKFRLLVRRLPTNLQNNISGFLLSEWYEEKYN